MFLTAIRCLFVCLKDFIVLMQMPEIVVVKGKEYKMITLPLESYWNKANPKPQFYNFLSGRSRGYLGKWAIRNQNLYLTHIEGWCIGLTPEYPPIPNGTSEVNPGTKTSLIRSWPFKSIYLRVLFPYADVSGQLANYIFIASSMLHKSLPLA